MFYGYFLSGAVNKLSTVESTNLSYNILPMKLSVNHYFLSSKVALIKEHFICKVKL